MEFIVIILSGIIIFFYIQFYKSIKAKKNISKNPNNHKSDHDNTSESDSKEDTVYCRNVYCKKELLSSYEKKFYLDLKPITDKYNLHIITKIRMADLLDIKPFYQKQWGLYFNKIKAKHIDFALCSKDDLSVLLLIELDDSSHNSNKSKDSDNYKNDALTGAGYQILRVKTPYINNLESAIVKILNLNITET